MFKAVGMYDVPSGFWPYLSGDDGGWGGEGSVCVLWGGGRGGEELSVHAASCKCDSIYMCTAVMAWQWWWHKLSAQNALHDGTQIHKSTLQSGNNSEPLPHHRKGLRPYTVLCSQFLWSLLLWTCSSDIYPISALTIQNVAGDFTEHVWATTRWWMNIVCILNKSPLAFFFVVVGIILADTNTLTLLPSAMWHYTHVP